MKSLKVICNKEGIEKVVKIIRDGGLAVFPTDTVYGIGCDPYNEKAVRLIYQTKKRDPKKLLPVLGFSKKDISQIAKFDKKSSIIADTFWPGPLTIILELKDDRIKKSLKLKEKIAVRVPNNQCALRILKKCKFLVGTSANVSTMKSIKNPSQIHSDTIQYDILIDNGEISSKGESTIIEFQENTLKVHRYGVISKEEILKVL